jgi:large repetitive protein
VSMGFLQATRWSFLSAIIIESYDSDTYAAPPILSQRIIRDITSQNLGEAKPNDVAAAEVKVFPNPFTGSLKINISAPSSQNISLKMFDISGKLIFSKNLGQVNGIRTENLSSSQLGELVPGTYILQVITNDKNLKTIKLIKNN